MEEIKKEHMGCGENMCQGGWCKKMCCGGKHTILRWIFGVIILIAVFSLGVKIGEFKSAMNGYGGFGWNMHRGGYPMIYGYKSGGCENDFGPGKMMRGWTEQQKASSTVK